MRNFVALSYRYDQFAALRAIKFFSWLRLTILKKPRQIFLFTIEIRVKIWPFEMSYTPSIEYYTDAYSFSTCNYADTAMLGWYQWSFFFISWQIQGLQTHFEIFKVFNTKQQTGIVNVKCIKKNSFSYRQFISETYCPFPYFQVVPAFRT